MSKRAAYDFPEHFSEFAMMPKFPEHIEALAGLAEPEDWDYKHAASSNP